MPGCMDPAAYNHREKANIADGECLYQGCLNSLALNHDLSATLPGPCSRWLKVASWLCHSSGLLGMAFKAPGCVTHSRRTAAPVRAQCEIVMRPNLLILCVSTSQVH